MGCLVVVIGDLQELQAQLETLMGGCSTGNIQQGFEWK